MPGVDDSAGLVKITIILGGPYWLDRNPLPNLSHEELVKASMATLRQHLPETAFPSPAYAYTTTQRNCIPHVPVGYFEEVRNLGRRLRAVEDVRVAVVGGGIASVGANGAVKAAYEVGESFAMNVMDDRRARAGTESWE